MPLPAQVRAGLTAWRRIAGEDSRLELWAKGRYLHFVSSQLRKERGSGWV